MGLFSCFSGAPAPAKASSASAAAPASKVESQQPVIPTPSSPQTQHAEVSKPVNTPIPAHDALQEKNSSTFSQSGGNGDGHGAASSSSANAAGLSNPQDRPANKPEAHAPGVSGTDSHYTPADVQESQGPAKSSAIPEPTIGGATAAHSLKLSSTNTLCQSNLQLCKPEELLVELKDLSFIGNGSFAAVFKGLWQGAKVAIKFVVSDTLNSNSVTLRESVLSQLLSHPNVIQTFTTRVAVMDDASLQRIHGQSDPARQASGDTRFVSGDGFGDPRHKTGGGVISVSNILLQLQVKPLQYVAVVIMEYADKGTLQEAIYKRQIFKESPRWNKRIAARALFRTAREIALGMQHLHNSNILHGDLKPGNVLLTSARVDRRGFIAKLADFGLSHVAPGPIATNTWGTLRYMAPEHFQGTMSRATDVFAFGMLLWEMVTGKKPYENMTQGEVIQSVSQGLRPQWPPDCFPHLEYLGKRCIAHNPADRPTFTEIVKELEDMEVMLRELLQATREGCSNSGLQPVGNEGSFSQNAAGTVAQQDQD